MNEKDYLGIIDVAKPLLDQINLSICFCDKEGIIVYINPRAAEDLKALGNLLGFQEIKTGFDVVGTHLSKWHHLRNFTEAMEKSNGDWGVWSLKGERWRSRSGCVRDNNGEVIGYIGAWEELDHGPTPEDKTETTYKLPIYSEKI
ncbi:MAG: hypothetical protein K9L30_13005 [Desulfobacterales bacterium]|nr:hypothetical protein [Desulfobacterales bacterium]